MPLSDREYIRGTHPPTCTCVTCCAKRLHHPKARKPSRRKPLTIKLLVPVFVFGFLIIAVGVLLQKPDIPWPIFPKEAIPPSPEAPPINPTPNLPAGPNQNNEIPQEVKIKQIEAQTFELINAYRQTADIPATRWDDKLYELSKAHTQKMASQGELFHSPETSPIAENCFGGQGYYQYTDEKLAKAIVTTWLSSPLHRAWLMHKPICTSVVTIVITPAGQYASWTFWMDEVNQGPELIRKIADEWENETNKEIPWLDWLRSKGYID